MIDQIARQYELSEQETVLLAAIRKAENGEPGLEFGVGKDEPGHMARRYAYSPTKSFLTQGRWAAGTIKKRYTGDLRAFARRYCPKNERVWRKNVESWMAKIEKARDQQ